MNIRRYLSNLASALVDRKRPFTNLRQLHPIRRDFGHGHGLCIDRYYIERFLEAHSADISGRVLEIANAAYTKRFGGDKVTKSEILHVSEGNPQATIVADLTHGEGIADDSFDCVILTQTLPFIFDCRKAIRTVFRILAPGGVVLVTCPSISQISTYDMEQWGDYWRFTSLSLRRLFEDSFGAGNVEVESYGNVMAAVAMLHGILATEISRGELDHVDNGYQVVVGTRAVKPAPKD